ncbi:MAG: heme biosynthesis HemY N-terminal domain-containing protein [Pseudomonadota bacterium]
MRTLVLVVVLLALAVVAMQLQFAETGVLTIAYQGWLVETSPVAMLIAFVVVVFLLMMFFKCLGWLLGAPNAWNNVFRDGRQNRAQKRLLKGFTDYIEGRWQPAIKQLTHPASTNHAGLINHLLGARAAHFQGDTEKRDQLLEIAAQESPDAGVSIDITRAELQLDSGDREAAQETLVFLRGKAPRNGHVVKLLAQVYHQNEEWSKLDALLPIARRLNAIANAELTVLEHDCQRGMISTTEENRVAGYWKRLPRAAQHDRNLLIAISQRMLEEGKPAVAEKLIRDHLSAQWDDELLPLYAQIETDDPAKQLDYAERWLGAHGRSASLLAALGQLCFRCKLWGKARVYLESSLGIEESPRASLLLAELLTQLGEQDAAREHYANGLRLALKEQKALVSIPRSVSEPHTDQPESAPNPELTLIESKG